MLVVCCLLIRLPDCRCFAAQQLHCLPVCTSLKTGFLFFSCLVSISISTFWFCFFFVVMLLCFNFIFIFVLFFLVNLFSSCWLLFYFYFNFPESNETLSSTMFALIYGRCMLFTTTTLNCVHLLLFLLWICCSTAGAILCCCISTALLHWYQRWTRSCDDVQYERVEKRLSTLLELPFYWQPWQSDRWSIQLWQRNNKFKFNKQRTNCETVKKQPTVLLSTWSTTTKV